MSSSSEDLGRRSFRGEQARGRVVKQTMKHGGAWSGDTINVKHVSALFASSVV